MVRGLCVQDALACSDRAYHPLFTSFGEQHALDTAGQDPNDPAHWSENYKRASEPVQKFITKEQEDIVQMQKTWREKLIAYDNSYTKLHNTGLARMNAWEVGRTRLERECNKLRDKLDQLMEAKELCARMQDEELPAMFTVKAKDPARFRRFGDIKGCVHKNLETGAFEKAPCECIDGTEKLGCKDSVGNIYNTLSCSHILNKLVPSQPFASYFAEGGACRINSKEAWNDGIVDKSVFEKSATLHKESIDLGVTDVLSVAPQCVHLTSRTQLRDTSAAKARRWSDFLPVAALDNDHQ